MGHLFASDDASLHNDPANPAGTWCSRTRWHRIDFVAVPREWFAPVKRAEVETSVALPCDACCGAGDFTLEGFSRMFKERWRFPRGPSASGGQQIENFWSHAPVPSGFSVDEHADLLSKAVRIARERAAPRGQAALRADWMDGEARQAVRSHAAARRVHQKASGFLSRAWLKTFFSQGRLRRDLEGLARLDLQIAW